jgi:hypothetical protein
MEKIREIGLVIYSYGAIEDHLEMIWNWISEIEIWFGRTFAEYIFIRRGKESHRLWKNTSKNRLNLYSRLQIEKPWFVLGFGWPEGCLNAHPGQSMGIKIFIKSWPQKDPDSNRVRWPSYISILVHPDVVSQKDNRFAGLLDLGVQAWDIIDGVYGFIDVDTGVPLQDDLLRNIDFFMSNLIPKEFQGEFRKWQEIQPYLGKKIWKIFWANFINANHITTLGDIAEMRRSDPYRHLEELQAIAYDKGIEKLINNSKNFHELRCLSHKGMLITISPSPLEWSDAWVQERRKIIQELIN